MLQWLKYYKHVPTLVPLLVIFEMPFFSSQYSYLGIFNSVSSADDNGNTLAHIAAYAGCSDTLRVISTYCNVRMANYDGLQPLHVAIAAGQVECVSVLLEVCSSVSYEGIIFAFILVF